MNIVEFIKKAPKAELHLHIEGTLEPDHMFALAKRNKIQIPFTNILLCKKRCSCARVALFIINTLLDKLRSVARLMQ